MHYYDVLNQVTLRQHQFRVQAERDALADEVKRSQPGHSLKQKLGLALVELGQRLAHGASPQQA